MESMINSLPTNPPLVEATDARICTTCGHQNPMDVEVCLHCAAALGTDCPVCGQGVPAGSKFCVHCGAPLPEREVPAASLQWSEEVRQNLRALMPTALARKISAASSEIMGERREVTVLFVNVSNCTATVDEIDSEDSFHLIDEALRLLVDVVYKYEGSIDKFTGDGLVALFGAPVAHENDPERAIRAALEMQAALQPWQSRTRQAYDFDVQMRIGINTGQVIAGKVGNDLHMDYTVIGETVNLAYHLELVAEPGTILVSPETHLRTRSLFEFKALPPLTIDWLPQPIQAFQPLQLQQKSGLESGVSGLQAPLIGRADELARLQHALSEVQASGQSRVALVTGQAGVGKSRLVAEFRRWLHASDVRLFQGGSLTYARSAPLWLAAELLRDMVQLAETDSGDRQRQTLRAYLAARDLAGSDILPYLAHVLGLAVADPQLEATLRDLQPAMLQRQTHAALRQLVVAEARSGPLVLIFEDLHWSDPASRDFLEYLIQTTTGIPILIVLVSREADGEHVLAPLRGAAERDLERLVNVQLGALTAAEGELLANQLIPQTTAAAWSLKQQIVARADGNPLYIEEIIRTLIDQGGLIRAQADGAWQVTAQSSELLRTVPGTVKGLILARFDRLPEEMRCTLQKAAVFGPVFSVDLLQQISDTGHGRLAGQLEQLQLRQFLTDTHFRSAPGYKFQHALIQETIYDTLLKRDRRKIHGQVAGAIEQSPSWLSDERAEVLAYHYSKSTEPTKALPYLISAANTASGRCAYETAIAHFRQALALLPDRSTDDRDEYFQVSLGLSRALKFVGEFAAAGELVSEALHYVWDWSLAAEADNLMPILIESLRQLADIRQREGVFDQALTYLESGLQVLGEKAALEETELWRALLDRMAWIRFRQGNLEQAFELATAATVGQNPNDAPDPIRLASLYNTLGGVCWQQGQLEQATSHVENSLRLYERVGYLWGTAVAYGNLGVIFFGLGNWPKANDYFERAYSIQQVIGNAEGQAVTLDNLGLLRMAQGDYETAQRDLETALSIRQRLGGAWGTAQSQVNLARLALKQSCFDEASTHAEAALTLSENIGSQEIQISARCCLAIVRAEQGQLQQGLQEAEQALQLARATGFMEGEIDCLRVAGTLYARLGNDMQAESHLICSADLSARRNARYQQGLALSELGQLYRQRALAEGPERQGWSSKAQTTLTQAAGIFDTLGAARERRRVLAALGEIQAAGR
jgi:class 3 adenylate cyclase/tetratricopeptide (TPR) repeat protein